MSGPRGMLLPLVCSSRPFEYQRVREVGWIPTGCSLLRLLCGAALWLLLMKKEEGASQATRAISTARLTAHAVCTCRLSTCSSRTALQRACALGVLILGGASHLDAFSGYPFPTSLPGDAPGGTAGTRVVGPSRSSRTRDGSPQHSNAHDGYRPNCLTTF